MRNASRWLVPVLLIAAALAGCGKEKTAEETQQAGFSFVVYPGARYLAQLTEMTKQAHKVINPNIVEPPPTAIYDTDAPIEKVVDFYAKSYGYTVAPDATNNLSATKPPAYYRSGDLGSDAKSHVPVLHKMNLKTDVTKAQGTYRAAEIEPRPNRPRVTIQRPYFDVVNSQVVDRTIILMTR